MILTCPACYKRYLVDIRSLNTERIVRCASCNHTWRQSSIPDKAEDLSFSNQNESKTENFLSKKSFLKSKLSLGWTFYSLTWGILMIIFIIARDPLIISFPPLYKIYKNFGMMATPPGYGFKIENVSIVKKSINNRPFLTVQGQILNQSRQVKLLPPLHIVYNPPQPSIQKLQPPSALVSEKNSSLEKAIHWSFTIPQDRLLAGEKIPFETTFPLPPSGFKGIIYF